MLLAAVRPAIVEGRVGEQGGAPAPFAQVTLVQGDRTQVVRTDADGKFRFRLFNGPGTLSVRLPQGWTSTESLSHPVGAALAGEVIHSDFAAVPRRILHGRLLLAGAPLPGMQLAIGG